MDNDYIFDVMDAALSEDANSKSHVFKMRKIAAKIAINMDKDGQHFMAKEYCFFRLAIINVAEASLLWAAMFTTHCYGE